MAAGWYCKIKGELLGPMPLAQIMGLAQKGTLAPDDMVRKKTGEWVIGSSIKGLFTANANTAQGPDSSDPSPEASHRLKVNHEESDGEPDSAS